MFQHKLDHQKCSNTTSNSSSTKSYDSGESHSTGVTTYSDVSRIAKNQRTCAVLSDWDYCRPSVKVREVDPTSSVEMYASTIESDDDSSTEQELSGMRSGYEKYDTDVIASNPRDFAKLFPSTRRFLLQHDDSTSDGNMNIRLDTEFKTHSGERGRMTLFHLRMKNLHDREFSLRRYWRESGREVCHARRKYVKPLPKPSRPKKSSLSRSITAAFQSFGIKSQPELLRVDSGYASDDEQESEDETKLFTSSSDVEATVPTNSIKLVFSNYAQVEVHRIREDHSKRYDFEYWGLPYTWQREVNMDDDESVYSYELINLISGRCIAYIMPDRLSKEQAAFEYAQGGWIPPCTFKVIDERVTDDVGDVIVATGLIALTDDCIQRNLRRNNSIHKTGKMSAGETRGCPSRIVDDIHQNRYTKAQR